MAHTATISLSYRDANGARSVERSLRPEVGDIEGDRTTARIARESATLSITVDAADLVALRAGLNTWLSLVTVAERAGDLDAPTTGAAGDGDPDGGPTEQADDGATGQTGGGEAEPDRSDSA